MQVFLLTTCLLLSFATIHVQAFFQSLGLIQKHSSSSRYSNTPIERGVPKHKNMSNKDDSNVLENTGSSKTMSPFCANVLFVECGYVFRMNMHVFL